MKDDGNWQDVAESLFGGGEEPQSVIEKPKRKPKSLLDRFYDWQLTLSNKAQDRVVIATLFSPVVIIIVLLLLWSIISGITVDRTACQDMLNWTIERIPARCLAELSEMKPR